MKEPLQQLLDNINGEFELNPPVTMTEVIQAELFAQTLALHAPSLKALPLEQLLAYGLTMHGLLLKNKQANK